MRDSFNEINITPLTDIFLVLLIIMMVIAPMLDQQGLNLAVPEVVKSEQIKSDSKLLEIMVTSNNEFIYQGEIVQSENLATFLKDKMQEFSDGLLIFADDNSEHGTIVHLMDTARNIGITSISLSRN